jgi:hypothetical protein
MKRRPQARASSCERYRENRQTRSVSRDVKAGAHSVSGLPGHQKIRTNDGWARERILAPIRKRRKISDSRNKLTFGRVTCTHEVFRVRLKWSETALTEHDREEMLSEMTQTKGGRKHQEHCSCLLNGGNSLHRCLLKNMRIDGSEKNMNWKQRMSSLFGSECFRKQRVVRWIQKAEHSLTACRIRSSICVCIPFFKNLWVQICISYIISPNSEIVRDRNGRAMRHVPQGVYHSTGCSFSHSGASPELVRPVFGCQIERIRFIRYSPPMPSPPSRVGNGEGKLAGIHAGFPAKQGTFVNQ